MSDRPIHTPADIELAREASRIATPTRVSPGQIKRWRNAGFLPMSRKGLGRGKGFSYEYPEGSAAFAAAIAHELGTPGTTIEQAAKAAFARGTSPASTKACQRMFAPSMEAALAKLDEDRFDSRLATKMSRRAYTSPLLTQAKEFVGSNKTFYDFLSGSTALVFGGKPSGLDQAMDALGVSGDTTAEISAGDTSFPLADVLETAKANLYVVLNAIRDASIAEYEQARDDALALVAGVGTILPALGDLVGADQGASVPDELEAMEFVPVTLVMRKHLGDEGMAGFLAMMADPFAMFGAVVESFSSWAREHPSDAARLGPIGEMVLRSQLEK